MRIVAWTARCALAVTALAGAAWAGCNSAYDEASAPPDGADAGDAAPGDATSGGDATASDASEGGPVVDGCAHDFCDDFEGVRMIRGSWSGYRVSSTMTGALEAGTFRLTMEPADAAAMEIAGGGVHLLAPWSPANGGGRRAVDIRFRAQLECPPTGDVIIASVRDEQKSVDLIMLEDLGVCYAVLRQIVLPSTYSSSPGVPITEGQWHQISLTIPETAPDAGGEATVTVDAAKTSLALTATKQPANFYGLLGLYTGGYAGLSTSARYDDVTIDYLK